MTLAKRIIPTVLVKGRTAVKGERFNCWRSIGLAIEKCRVHARRGVDELVLLDVSATAEGRGPDLDLVRELSSGCWIPITVGGGVRSLQDIDALLRAGADKVAVCTWLHACGQSLLSDAAKRFGSQAIVACVEYGLIPGYGVMCMHHCASQASLVIPQIWAWECAEDGAGEILLQSVDRDGTMAGYDLDLIREVSQAVSIPVIASGGCSGYEDMQRAFEAGADACAVGALFSFCDETPRGAAKFLADRGFTMRIP